MTKSYGSVFREVPIVPMATMSLSLVRGMVVQWGSGTGTVGAWLSGATPALGVATSDADRDLQQVDVYCGKGCSVLIKCDVGVVPNPNDFLFWSAPGVVSNTGTAGQQFARAIGVGFNGYVEAIIV